MNVNDENVMLNCLFNVGFVILDYHYELSAQVINPKNYIIDPVEPQTEMYIGPKELIISQFMPLILSMSYIFGKDAKVDANISRGQSDNSFLFHSDFYDKQSDFFILFYPKQWDIENGGCLELGGKNLLTTSVDHYVTFEPSLCQIVLINNLNPLFVHKVQPILKNHMERYLGCIEITRGSYGTHY